MALPTRDGHLERTRKGQGRAVKILSKQSKSNGSMVVLVHTEAINYHCRFVPKFAVR